MPATEVLLQGATQVTSSLNAPYTAGGGSMAMAAALVDHGGSPLTGSFEILVGRNRPSSERRYFVATPSGSNLTVTASPGYTDNQSYLTGDLIDVVSAWETERRLRAFATLHTHGGGVDGTLVVTAAPPTTEAMGDAAAVGAGVLASREDHKHGMPSFATPAILLGSSAAAGSAATPIRSDGTIAAFDATVPTTQAFGDAAAVGSAAFAARRDHKHAMMANPVGAPATWTVGAITQAASTPAFTTNSARQITIGKLALIEMNVAFTGAGTAGSAIAVTLPAGLTLASSGAGTLGSFTYNDISTTIYTGSVLFATTTTLQFIASGNANYLGATPNFAIANGDSLSLTVMVELA